MQNILFTTSELESESYNEEENKSPGQKRNKVLLTSETETDSKDQRIETAAYGTIQEEINGRLPVNRLHNIFRNISGPTEYAK